MPINDTKELGRKVEDMMPRRHWRPMMCRLVSESVIDEYAAAAAAAVRMNASVLVPPHRQCVSVLCSFFQFYGLPAYTDVQRM